jgi:hypothetical protein
MVGIDGDKCDDDGVCNSILMNAVDCKGDNVGVMQILCFIELHKKLEGKEHVVEFDFLGKDSIHYHNIVQVEKRVGGTRN